jgi:3-deoxy-D-manno-octulosonic-acid transferase
MIFKKKYREGLWARLGIDGLPESPSATLWIHGSSVGEILLIKPLINRLGEILPHTPLVISAFTPTGKLTAQKAYPQHQVLYFPLDLSFIIQKFFRRLKPKAIIIVESEFWPNFILTAYRNGIPIILLNGKLSEKSYRIYKNSKLFSRVLKKISLLAVQNEEYANRFQALGIPPSKIIITGNMKYDLTDVSTNNGMQESLRRRFGYPEDNIILIGGSTHSGEDEALIYAFSKLRKEGHSLDLVLAPRYPENVPQIEEVIKTYGFIPVRKTVLDKKDSSIPVYNPNKILIIDTMGELKIMYSMADIAYVGGSLFFRAKNKGGHNMMEPAILGKAVMFGPHNYTFKDTVEDLLAKEAAIMVSHQEDIYQEVKKLLLNQQRIRDLGEKAREVILQRLGSTQRNLELLHPFLRVL